MQTRKNTKTFNEPCNLSSNEVEQNPKELEVNHPKHRRPSFNNHQIGAEHNQQVDWKIKRPKLPTEGQTCKATRCSRAEMKINRNKQTTEGKRPEPVKQRFNTLPEAVRDIKRG